jgi:hypothetical protein
MLSLLIPSPTYPGKDFDVFMQPLVEELQKLWKDVSTRDMLQPEAEPFKLHVVVLYCTHDYPGRVTSGYNACAHCDKEQMSKKLIHKVGFFGVGALGLGSPSTCHSGRSTRRKDKDLLSDGRAKALPAGRPPLPCGKEPPASPLVGEDKDSRCLGYK